MNKIKRNFLWNLSGIIFYSASQWLILVLMAKFGTVEGVGKFGLALAITAPAFQFTNMGLRALVTTDATRSYLFANYMSTRLFMTCCALVFILALIVYMDLERETALVVFLITVSKMIEATSDLLYGFMQKHEQLDFIAKSLISKGLMMIALVAVILITFGSISAAAAGIVVAWGLVFLFFDVGASRQVLESETISLKSDIHSNLSLLKSALPLGIFAAVMSLNTGVPRFFINSNLGEEAVGYFTALQYMIIAGMAISTALQQAASSQLAKNYHDGIEPFVRLFGKLLMVGILVGVGSILFAVFIGDFFLTTVYGEDYAEYTDVFIVLMIGGSAIYIQSYVLAALTAIRVLNIQAVTAVVGFISSVLSCWLLIPEQGLMGAGKAVVISYWVTVIILSLILCHKIFEKRKAALPG